MPLPNESARRDGAAHGAASGLRDIDAVGYAEPPQHEPEPSLFVIFGATGDLSRRKILPALYQLHVQGLTKKGLVVLGVTRDDNIEDEAFRQVAIEAVHKAAPESDAAAVQEWAQKFVYFQDVDEEYGPLVDRIAELEKTHSLPGNRSFYLSLPPGAFPPTVEKLGKAGLNQSPGWTRLVIEKPFGRDLASAKALNELVHRCFSEDQIYRIDHYLGKETVQNLIVFRFANAMFESLWSRDRIESVTITVAEELGVEKRAGYYEQAGALRDMVQSHLTQLLTLVAMDVPSGLDAAAIRAEKIKVLRSIRPISPDDAVLGQYEPGQIDDKDVPGYREEPGVSPDSRTETFAALTLHLENWRWQGVPFYLRTGKRMPRRLTEIEIKFRRAPVWMFRSVVADELHRNTLLVTLQPNEGFSLFFDVKAPGEPFRLRRLPLHFSYDEEFAALPEAYQTLILDLLLGDQTLFVHADEVETSWALYAPLLDGRRAVYPYPAGTWGPIEAELISSRAPLPGEGATLRGTRAAR
jgi:glucose-6-phosphate 1-dehydrogenase